MISPQSIPVPTRLLGGAALAAFGALMIAMVASGIWWAPIALVVGLGTGWLALARLELIPALFVFGLFLNLPVVATKFHGLPPMLGMAFFGLLAIPVAVRAMIRRDAIYVDAVFITMLLLLAAFSASSLGARDTALALEKNVKFALEGVAIYLLMINAVRSERDLRFVLWGLLAAAAIISAVVVHQELTKNFTDNYLGFAQRHAEFKVGTDWRDRAAGPIGDPNYFAQILLIPLPVAIVFCVTERRWPWRLAALATTALIVGAVALTYSRGGALGLGVVLLLTALMLRVRIPVIIAGGLTLLLMLSVLSPEFFGRIASIADVRHIASGQSDNVQDRSFAGRLGENLAAWNVFIDHPVFGVGPDNFIRYYQEYADELGMLLHAEDRPAHNMYLSIAAEMGLVGLMITLAVMIIPLLQLWAVYRDFSTTRPFLAKTAAALFVSIIGYMLTGVLLTLAYERYFWCLLALAGATTLIARLARQDAGAQRALRQEAAHG